MPYCKLYYHLVWATRDRQPILTGAIERIVHGLMVSKARNLGAHVHAIGGIEDHVHTVAEIPPKIVVATFVGQVKAVATTKFNKSGHPMASLYWQKEYAAFSIDEKRLPNYIRYVERQKEHLAANNLIPILERTESVNHVRETQGNYAVELEQWWLEVEKVGL